MDFSPGHTLMKLLVPLVLFLHVLQATSSEDELDKRGLGIIRMGKRADVKMFRLGRGMRMLRVGKKFDPYTAADEHYDSYNNDDMYTRQAVPYPRIGKDLDSLYGDYEYSPLDSNIRALSADDGALLLDYLLRETSRIHGPRVGRYASRIRRSEGVSKRCSGGGCMSMPRLGSPAAKRDVGYQQNRNTNKYDYDLEKPFRSASPYPRIGRLQDSFPVDDDDKRAAFRLGKRLFRLGKKYWPGPLGEVASYDQGTDEDDKRRFRLGKKDSEENSSQTKEQ